MELDTTKLKQAGFRKTVSHDNCNVLDIGSGSFPRYIEVRPPGDDGSRMTAIWDGILNLAVNDKVICMEYAGNPIWRVNAIGGGGSGVGTVRVNKVFASDFSSESLVTDASDNITINTGTLTLPSDIIHLSDTDTLLSFTDDKFSITTGGLVAFQITETTQDLIEIGDVAGGGDWDIDFNSGTMFLSGSSGRLGIGTGTGTPRTNLDVLSAGVAATFEREAASTSGILSAINIIRSTTGTSVDDFAVRMNFQLESDAGTIRTVGTFDAIATDITDASMDGAFAFSTREDLGAVTEQMRIEGNGNVRVGPSSVVAGGRFHVDQNSSSAAIPVMVLDQADVDEPFIKYIGSAAAATLTRSIVAEADVTTATRQGFVKIEIDDVGNQVTDQDYFVAFYTLA